MKLMIGWKDADDKKTPGSQPSQALDIANIASLKMPSPPKLPNGIRGQRFDSS
jgi:hypothetical protein